MIAHVTGLKPGEFVHTLGDTHVYLNHVEPLKEQLTRDPKPFPKIVIKRKVENIEDFTIDDFEVQGYDPHPKITMELAVWSWSDLDYSYLHFSYFSNWNTETDDKAVFSIDFILEYTYLLHILNNTRQLYILVISKLPSGWFLSSFTVRLVAPI